MTKINDNLEVEIHREISRAVSELPFQLGAIWLDCNMDYGEICFSYGEKFSFEIEEWADAGYDYKSQGWNKEYWDVLEGFCIEAARSTLETEFMLLVCGAIGSIEISALGENIQKPLVVMCIEHDDSMRGAIRRYSGIQSSDGIEFAKVEN